MTPRPTRRRGLLGLALLAILPAALAGCDPRQAMFFLQPFDPKIAAPCPSMKGKRVVVLVAAAPGTTNEYVNIDGEIAIALAGALRANVKRIDVVDVEKVRDWQRSKQSMTDPADAARAFEADMVIFIEVQKFQIQNPVDLAMYQGKAQVSIQVHELKYPTDDHDKPMKDKEKVSEIVYEGDRDTEFPVTGGISMESGVSKSTFKNRFMKVLNEQISWHFIEHAQGDNIQDTRFQ